MNTLVTFELELRRQNEVAEDAEDEDAEVAEAAEVARVVVEVVAGLGEGFLRFVSTELDLGVTVAATGDGLLAEVTPVVIMLIMAIEAL